MLEMLCVINSGLELVKIINLDNSLKHDLGDLSSIYYDPIKEKTFILSDSNSGYFIRVDDKLPALFNENLKEQKYLNSNKQFLTDSLGIFSEKFDTEGFYLDEKYMYLLSEVSGEKSKSYIIKYDLNKNFITKVKLINDPNENYYSISEFEKNNLIIISKNISQNKTQRSELIKYKILTKNFDDIYSGYLETKGRINDFHKVKGTDIYLSLSEKKNDKNIGVYVLDDFKKNSNIVSYKYFFRLPLENKKQLTSLQGISMGPVLDKKYYSLLAVNDNNNKLLNSRNKLKKLFNKLKLNLLKIFKIANNHNSNIFIFRFKENSCLN